MGELVPFLKDLLSAPGLSGHEEPVRKIIAAKWQPLCDELVVSRMGSLEAIKRGSGPEPRPRIMLATHMDAIGMMVTDIVDGFLSLTQIGGVDRRVLPGTPVIVHGRETLPGVVVQPPDFLVPGEFKNHPIPMQHLWVDVGLLPDDVKQLVRPGDLIAYATTPVELSGETLSGHTLDNRSSVAAVTVCLEILQKRIHACDVYAVATTQEETAFGGGYTSTFGIQPDLGIAIDVCHAKGPGTSEAYIPTLGKGLVLGLGPNVHPYLYKAFKKVADEMEITYVSGPMATHSGTDAYPMQVTATGMPTMVISIPLRYMHTPVELVSLKDIRRVGRILAEFITSIDQDFVNNICWEE
jgi:tetrahedral aminopeptidase